MDWTNIYSTNIHGVCSECQGLFQAFCPYSTFLHSRFLSRGSDRKYLSSWPNSFYYSVLFLPLFDMYKKFSKMFTILGVFPQVIVPILTVLFRYNWPTIGHIYMLSFDTCICSLNHHHNEHNDHHLQDFLFLESTLTESWASALERWCLCSSTSAPFVDCRFNLGHGMLRILMLWSPLLQPWEAVSHKESQITGTSGFCHSLTEHSGHRMRLSLEEMIAIISTSSFRDLIQRFCLERRSRF